MRAAHSYSERLVLRVNEVFHDVEGRHYEDMHPDIFDDEVARWEAVGARIAAHPGVRVLDLGAGTGFVSLTVGRALGADDLLICADISAGKLEICDENLRAAALRCGHELVKLDGKTLPVAPVDFVLMNSVVHHIPDLSAFFAEIDRVLKPGGVVVIAHEPNQAFFEHPFLSRQMRVMGALSSPRALAGSVLRRLHLLDPARRVLARFSPREAANTAILDEVNAILLRENAIDRALSQAELTMLVDVHSPTAGGFHKGWGIDVDALGRDHLPGYTLELDTYSYGASRFGRYERWLGRTFPRAGSTLFAIFTKPVR